MRIHHLNCGSMCPVAERLVNGRGKLFGRGSMVCHCLLVEAQRGLVLVDTGIGLDDIADPAGRLGKAFLATTGARLDPEETAAKQVERLGFSRRDVTDLIVTHLDLDHAGGISDFPDAKVHVFGVELDSAMSPRTFLERERYRAAQWAHAPKWTRYAPGGEPWFGFPSVRGLEGLPPEILLVPLAGHTRGHVAVAVQASSRWSLHCGDAYFFHGEVDGSGEPCPLGLRIFQSLVEIDRTARLGNQARLRQLVRDHGAEVDVFSAHDPVELARYAPADAIARDAVRARAPA